jgi:hypothetical protein
VNRSRAVGDRGELRLIVPKSLIEALRAAADERVLSLNLLVEKLLEDGLARLVPIDELLITRRSTSHAEAIVRDEPWPAS